MKHHKTWYGVDNLKPVRHIDNGQHQDLERYKVTCHKQKEKRQRPLKLVDSQRISGHTGERYRKDCRWHSNQQRVDQILDGIGFGKNLTVVLDQLE